MRPSRDIDAKHVVVIPKKYPPVNAVRSCAPQTLEVETL
jgi:hypothetical protein